MTPDSVIELTHTTLYLVGLLGAPILGAALVVGVTVSTLQAATQINEMTLTFIPKLLAVAAVLYGSGSWMLQHWLSFTRELWMTLSMPGPAL